MVVVVGGVWRGLVLWRVGMVWHGGGVMGDRRGVACGVCGRWEGWCAVCAVCALSGMGWRVCGDCHGGPGVWCVG